MGQRAAVHTEAVHRECDEGYEPCNDPFQQLRDLSRVDEDAIGFNLLHCGQLFLDHTVERGEEGDADDDPSIDVEDRLGADASLAAPIVLRCDVAGVALCILTLENQLDAQQVGATVGSHKGSASLPTAADR